MKKVLTEKVKERLESEALMENNPPSPDDTLTIPEPEMVEVPVVEQPVDSLATSENPAEEVVSLEPTHAVTKMQENTVTPSRAMVTVQSMKPGGASINGSFFVPDDEGVGVKSTVAVGEDVIMMRSFRINNGNLYVGIMNGKPCIFVPALMGSLDKELAVSFDPVRDDE